MKSYNKGTAPDRAKTMQPEFSKHGSSVNSDRILYTASSFARSSLLHLQEAGKLTALKEHVSRREGLPSFLFFTVTDGEGSLSYGGREYSLKKGSCVFIDCRKDYSHSTRERLWSLWWCHFFGPSVSSIYEKYVERGGQPVFTPEDTAPFLTVLDTLMATARSSDYMRDMKVNEALSSLLTLIMAQSWHPELAVPSSKRAGMVKVKEYLDENYMRHISLDDLAERFFISKYYLTRSFKDRFGMSINSYIRSVRITHAKQLLRFSDKTVEAVGAQVGFEDPAYFSRLFKEVEGVSPARFREQW